MTSIQDILDKALVGKTLGTVLYNPKRSVSSKISRVHIRSENDEIDVRFELDDNTVPPLHFDLTDYFELKE